VLWHCWKDIWSVRACFGNPKSSLLRDRAGPEASNFTKQGRLHKRWRQVVAESGESTWKRCGLPWRERRFSRWRREKWRPVTRRRPGCTSTVAGCRQYCPFHCPCSPPSSTPAQWQVPPRHISTDLLTLSTSVEIIVQQQIKPERLLSRSQRSL